ncbi:phosphoglycolate phosphatase-like HAD superfamily hydrolase [Actinoplanes teichomyceticus]|uniref:Phosphoglycolate phosphatase-like HAD superfamily hydrolase n=2 Tax=Actinoplanes teichomyceticus TaxID=1867 RepID=A0A561WI17_ACTTI|nr:phosphoglycolate phosphatase-like HAD superfamily hydrolase [Actinoplanes teichomyceticus]GIF16153.1 haloacid dehalogenase [Actinoplanes teichomyceticus]
MWDIDYTLLRTGGVAARAWRTAFTEVTGVPWRDTPVFAGRTDLDICDDVFAAHGVTDCTPERFFARYVEIVGTLRHEFARHGALMPGVREVLGHLGDRPDVVQTLVTGNVPEVAAAKVAAFGLSGSFDAEVGGYGTDDSVRATLVLRSLQRAEAKYGERFHPVVVGDTVHDVTAALANGAVAVAVATGSTPAAELAAAGAHVVLPDLSDRDAAVRALTTFRAA